MTNRRQNLYFLFQFTIPWVLLTLAFTTIAHIRGSSGEGGGSGWLRGSLIWVNLIGLCLWSVLFLPIFLVARKFYFESNHNYLRNFLIHLAHGALFLIFQLAVYTIASGAFAPEFWAHYPELTPYIKGASMGSLSLAVTFYAGFVFAIQTYLARLRNAEEEKRTAQLQSELARAQLQALKMQIQPHFLFNTLNSISYLVQTNPPQAQQMIAQLADFFRLTLDYSDDQLVTLTEEFRFLRSYLEIEQIRFSDRLTVNFDVEPDILNVMVPHLVLQPIVENSIKHAVSRRKTKAVIEIKAQRLEDKLRLQIKDNGTGEIGAKIINLKEIEPDKSAGTGLANVRNRLAHFYGKDAYFELVDNESEGATATLVIPLNFEIIDTRKVE